MARRRLIWQIFPTYVVVLLAALLAVTAYTTRSIRQFYQDRIKTDLEARARLMAEPVTQLLEEGAYGALDVRCKEWGGELATRVTVILPGGEVVGDSERAPNTMDNHAQRPEFVEVREGLVGSSIRVSGTLQEPMMYVALALRREGRLIGFVRTAVSLTAVREALWDVYARIAAGGAVVALLAGVVSWLVSKRISRPLEHMTRGAERFARGDFKRHLPMPRTREMATLAEAMNQMAEHLDDRIRTVIRQSNLQEAVLSSMVEGVLAVDTEERIISLNQAAAGFMDVERERATGRELEQVIRNAALQEFVSKALKSPEPVEGVVTLHTKGEQVLQVHGAILRDGKGEGIGAVVVLNDVTRLRRLEQVRQDFVANVSHELRTPITSIKGFVETLLDGAPADPEEARHFLDIVAKQADRLNAILEDLLTLSRMEQDRGREEMELTPHLVRDVLRTAVELCAPRARAKDIELALHCDEALEALANAPLLEQAVVNLIDNAVKYSDPHNRVEIRAERRDEDVAVEVRDHGCGIPSEHLPRLFERFYRVDKARSRRLGGTGLGLAIVKHIAQAHKGHVSVESTAGKGSVFTLHVPASPPAH